MVSSFSLCSGCRPKVFHADTQIEHELELVPKKALEMLDPQSKYVQEQILVIVASSILQVEISTQYLED